MTNVPPSLENGAESGLRPAQVRAWALEAGFAEAGLVALPHKEAARDPVRETAPTSR